MAVASPSAPSFSVSFRCRGAAESCISNRLTWFPSVAFTRRHHRQSLPCVKRLSIASSLNSSRSSQDGDVQYEFQQRGWQEGSPVYVKLPMDAVGPTVGQLWNAKTMSYSLHALADAGVEGVVLEIWWGLVERYAPGVYNWHGYKELVELAMRSGLKVRVVMAFHQCGMGPDDPHWISLPRWVLEEIQKNPDLAYADKFGRRNMEYISLGCDTLPVLRGRSPLQAYADFMRNFRDTFGHFLGFIITGIQVGMGPSGELRYPLCKFELRYPSCTSEKLTWSWHSHELGEFQCYDKYMLASLNACAKDIGMPEWGNGGPVGASNLIQNPENTDFFGSDNGSWNTPYGKFFLEWYSGMLLWHGEIICREAESIFQGTEVNKSAKVAAIYWHYDTQSHPSELTAGYYNTSTRDGYLPIARMFARYGFTLCCTGFERQDAEEKKRNPVSSPEGFLRQLLLAAKVCDVPLEGENYATTFDDESFQQVLKMLKFYSYGLEKYSLSFNFERMDKNLFDNRNWIRFVRFVKQMSDANTFRANLGIEDDVHWSSTSGADKIGTTFAYC
ncbi:Glycoside hydrolase [Theobroma cacao]|nr:Glycoside hydrolase [Theobroma cacao]